MPIYRELKDNIQHFLTKGRPHGLILTGIVGCGKTTLIEIVLNELQAKGTRVFKFSGDDVRFREAVAEDSNWIWQQIASVTSERSIVFVDEVQKTEPVFDALKIAFDRAGTSFVVSGSNPDFLHTTAKNRLQRRADIFYLLPFSIPEILAHQGHVDLSDHSEFYRILQSQDRLESIQSKVERTPEIEKTLQEYLISGGIPLAYLAQDSDSKLREIRQVVERGFDQISRENDSVTELIRIELARLHAREFAYQGIFARTRLRRRERVNQVIDQLINHGYLSRRSPMQLREERRTYLTILSFVDPGVVTYLSGEDRPSAEELGFRIEGIIHTRLSNWIANSSIKMELGYFKPYHIDINGKIKYLTGEVDFIVRKGRRVIPIEVKMAWNRSQIDLSAIQKFLSEHKQVPFGIVLYGGIPWVDHTQRLLFWPWWFV